MKRYNLPSMLSVPETLILANGEYPSGAITLALLKNAKLVICCDGAVDTLLAKGDKTPDAIVGDCDSIDPATLEQYENIVTHAADQETNDLTKAMRYCVGQGFKKVTILGATGKREDHTIGNISLLGEYIKEEGVEIEMVSDFGVFNVIRGNSEFESYMGQPVSLFNPFGSIFTTHYLKYPVRKRALKTWWQGTLNQSLAKTFRIETTGRLIVYRAF